MAGEQTATASSLEDAQRIMIDAARYPQESNAPSWNLVEKFTLAKGEKSKTVPKVGSYTISDLTDGTDLTTLSSINMTTVSLTTSERGAMVVITDKLARQNATTDVFQMVGRQFGNAAARKQETEVQALYSGLNGGVAFGAAGDVISLAKLTAGIARARGGGSSGDNEPFDPTYGVIHPFQAYTVTKEATTIGNNTQRVNDRREEAMLNRFFAFSFGGTDFFDSKDLTIDSSGDVVGVIAQRDALAGITSHGWTAERERNASLRATEVVFTADIGFAELDDKHGAPLLYDAAAPSTST